MTGGRSSRRGADDARCREAGDDPEPLGGGPTKKWMESRPVVAAETGARRR